MMYSILCINPWIYDFAAYNTWIEPLGLLTVAGVLRAAGHRVSLIDCLDRHHPDAPAPRASRDAYGCGQFHKVELHKPPVLAHVPRRWGCYGLPAEVFERELDARPRPDAVLVTSAMTYWYPGPFEAIRRVRARWPGVPVALGGVYATLCADHARAHSGADAVLPGPGEGTALQWVNEVTGVRPGHGILMPRDAPSTVAHQDPLRNCGSGIPMPRSGVPPSANAPLPAHDLRRPQGYVAVQTAQGCPYHCPYCAVDQLAPRGFHPRSPERVVDEIAWCVETLGARDVAFYDDALLCDAERHILPILECVLSRGLDVRFHTPNGLHARFIDRDLALKMRQAGFVTLRLGLESADPGQQHRDGDKVDRDRFARAVEALWAAGYTAREVMAYVLIGRPGQDVEAVRDTVAYAHGLGVPVSAAQFSPIPGTREWAAAVAAGDIAANADPLLHNNSVYPCASVRVRADTWEALKVEIRAENRALWA
jgi:radical SAM superfamily enzyme YgiQ (UPF0313 family)